MEECKIKLANGAEATLCLDFIERGLALDCQRDEFEEATSAEVAAIATTIQECLTTAQISAQQISSVFLTGGTTGLPSVRHAVSTLFADSKLVQGDRFGSVGMGLTLDAMRRFA